MIIIMWEQIKSSKDKESNISMQGIINWINHLLNVLQSLIKLKLTRIEQLGSGAVYCQLFSLIHPGVINMSKVNWTAKNQYEFINNLKLLQTAFLKAGINRPLQLLKLSKAKVPDNFQLAIWLRNYYFQHCLQTDCTLNSQVSSKVDFSFAHSKVRPKLFNPYANREQEFCNCCTRTETQNYLAKKIEIIEVKLEMIRELISSQANSEDKLNMIGEVIHLQYEQ